MRLGSSGRKSLDNDEDPERKRSRVDVKLLKEPLSYYSRANFS